MYPYKNILSWSFVHRLVGSVTANDAVPVTNCTKIEGWVLFPPLYNYNDYCLNCLPAWWQLSLVVTESEPVSLSFHKWKYNLSCYLPVIILDLPSVIAVDYTIGTVESWSPICVGCCLLVQIVFLFVLCLGLFRSTYMIIQRSLMFTGVTKMCKINWMWDCALPSNGF